MESPGSGSGPCSFAAAVWPWALSLSPYSLVSHLLNKDQGGRLPPPLSLGNQEEPITLWGMLRNTFKIDDVGPAMKDLHTTTVIKASD